jgi:ABC-type transporter Mla MlaB component
MPLRRLTVTCKIHREAVGESRVLLRVSGRLTGDYVKTLKTLLEKESSALTLDLKEVRLVDSEAVKLLATHESHGVRIENCPLYVREWIRREREAT